MSIKISPKIKEIIFYVVMSICAVIMFVLGITNLINFNEKNLLVDIIGFILFVVIIIQKMAKERKWHKTISWLSWFVLGLLFIAIAAEANILF